MKAIVYRRFGLPDILEYREVEKPVPGPDEVLIKIRAASINPLDGKMMKGGPFLFRLLFGMGKPSNGPAWMSPAKWKQPAAM